MENILLEKTNDTPYVRFERGYLEIEGRSIPENVHTFYQEMYNWVEEYIKNPESYTKIIVNLEYTNSSSNKYINDMLKKLGEAFDKGFDMKVFWKFEEDDDSIKQIGEDLESILNIPFKYIEYEEIRIKVEKLTIKNKDTGELSTISMRLWDTIKRNGHEDEYEVIEQESDDDYDDYDDEDFDDDFEVDEDGYPIFKDED